MALEEHLQVVEEVLQVFLLVVEVQAFLLVVRVSLLVVEVQVFLLVVVRVFRRLLVLVELLPEMVLVVEVHLHHHRLVVSDILQNHLMESFFVSQ